MKRLLVMSCVAVALGSCSEEVSRLNLILGGIDNDGQGFVCRQDDDPSKLLLERIVVEQKASMVVDFLRLDGVPGCRIQEILGWCQTHECRPIPEHRICIEFDVEGISGSGEALGTAIRNRVGAQINGSLITEDAPQEPVMIRVVLVAESCDDVPRAGDPDLNVSCNLLAGCVYSCPVTLGALDGDVVLDLDVFNDMCEQQVEVCASSEGFDVANVCTL